MMVLLPRDSTCLVCGGEVVDDRPELARADPVRGAILAFNERDVERLTSFMSPRVVWRPTSVLLGDLTRVYTGHEEMAAWTRDLASRWSDARYVERDLQLVGQEQVLTVGALTATQRDSGTGLAEAVALIFRVVDQLIVAMDEYLDLDEAARVAGIEHTG